MKKTYIAVLLQSVSSLASGKLPPLLTCTALAGAMCFNPAALADPDPGQTNGNVVLYQGNQSAGVSFNATAGGPTTILVSNLSPANITPLTFTNGVAIAGQVDSNNLTAIVGSNIVISTTGDSTYGIFAGNGGSFDGTYQFVTNSFNITYAKTNGMILTAGATNVMSHGTNVMANGTNVMAGATNVVISISTNFIYGAGNNYTNVAPSGGATVVNAAQITTHGTGSYGIFAQSQPGTISLSFQSTSNVVASQTFGNAGPVNVVNSGNITTYGDGAHGIYGFTLGGDGPEDSATSGNGSDVSVQTTGGTITTYGNGSYGIYAFSKGGNNTGGESGGAGGDGSDGGAGGDGGFVTVVGTGVIQTTNDNAGGIFAMSQAGNGGNGGNGGSVYGSGGSGGPGGKGSNVVVSGNWTITTMGTNANGISAQSLGGVGGSGGDGSHFVDLGGGNGGGTGDGGTVTVVSGGNIQTYGYSSLGIFARSLGGFAGNGGNSYNAFYSDAGDGNSAGAGGLVNVVNTGSITTEGDLSQGIYAESVGGGGGSAGSGGALVSLGSSGGAGGNAGNVTVTNFGTIITYGNGSHGIEAQSLGGGGGDGGNAGGLVSMGGSGSIASTGAVVTVYSAAAITTFGSNADAILAQSIGGGGGNAGSAYGAASLGATGGGGGDGGAVHVFNLGQLQATGTNSYGILAQSIGGGGGTGSGAGGVFAVGGSGGTSSQGDVVTVMNSGSILSSASAIFAQSIGGGGGNGGNADGWFPIGGSGSGGGNGAAVTVNNTGDLHTLDDNSSALLAQSIGGGGGNGGNAIGAGAFAAVAIGGNGSVGGNGDVVAVTSGTNTIVTQGNNSYGIDAESIGGGGGNGGYAIAASVGDVGAASLSIGGSGGGGGSASTVSVFSQSEISTYGTNSHGLFAQSIGGGGGNGGFAVAVSGSSDASLSLAMGGDAGQGGNGGLVDVTNTGTIMTASNHSYGIIAQSIGGGGGDGGFAVAGAISGKSGISASLAFGGTGGAGGTSSTVNLINSGDVTTFGDDSHGIMAQSVGGGGGSGGFSVTGDMGGGAIGASFGGSGGGAGAAGNVLLSNSGNITTYGARSDGLLAQSVGGGGGNGGFSMAGNLAQNATLGLSFGGTGGSGGSAGSVILTNLGTIITGGDNSQGILAQSVGGGGGDGGFAGAASFTKGAGVAANLAMGGNATTGGVASAVSVYSLGQMIATYGTNADGILAQSIGGGGGNGGFAAAASLGTGTNSVQAAVGVGGNGGSGNISGVVTVENSAEIMTAGNNSMGIFAQSVGGGGGNGGMAIAGTFSTGESGNVSVTIGGTGGAGANANSVTVDDSGNIATFGDEAHGIFAQSVGGGGGNGGMALSLDFALGNTNGTAQFALAIGGNGTNGGYGSNVVVTGTNTIFTGGQDSYGVFAQSVGGGGGNGGMALAATAVFKGNQGTNTAIAIAVGGNAGDGGDGGSVLVDRAGNIMTTNDGSYGIVAQSIGGGGGNAGDARAFSLFTRGGGGNDDNTTNRSYDVSVGGQGGSSGSGGIVTVTNVGSITTFGAGAYGILAQSVGGGGGTGGDAHSSTDGLIPSLIPGLGDIVEKVVDVDAHNVQIVVGGSGGSSGNGAQVVVNQQGDITTFGAGSYGIFAQSVGAGGGVAGNGGIGFDGQIGIGGAGGAAGNGSDVTVLYTGNILTAGDGSAGILAQSVGGGGGAAGNMDRGMSDEGLNIGSGFAFGRDGGSAGSGGNVNVTVNGTITTGGNGADGILAQSVGGGGGLVGDLGNSFLGLTFKDFAGSVGGSGDAGDVTVSLTGRIVTFGRNSAGIFAQSAGGTNGYGGNVRVTLNGSILAEGQDSDGIFAQSGGGYTVVTAPIPTAPAAMVSANAMPSSEGTVTVTISSNSFVQGGLGNSVGVRFLGGSDNILTNFGTITTIAGLNGTAVSGISANSYIYNYGSIIGSIDLGTNGNSFNNNSFLRSGAMLNIGSGNTFINSGMLSVGAPSTIQNTMLTGGFLQTSNGSLVVGLASPTSYNALYVSDSASLAGNLGVYLYNYLPVKGAQFNVLTATNISGTFDSFSDPLAGNYALQLQTNYSSTNVELQVIQASFSQFAHTPNQRAVAKDLNSFSGLGTTNTADPRGAVLIAFLNTQDASQLPGDFDLISPASLGAMFDLDFASLNQMSGNLEQRMSEIRLGNHEASGSISAFDNHAGAIQIASLGHQLPPMSAGRPDDWGFFAAGHGQYVDVNGNTNAAGYHFDSGGVTLGIDHMVCDNVAFGVTGDYTGTKATLINDGSVTVNSGRLGIYGTWFNQNSYVEGTMGGGYNDYSTVRGGLGGNASGHATGGDFDFMLGSGYYFRAGKFLFGPAGNIHYAYAQINQFTETGSMAPLTVEDNNSQSFLTELGARAAYDMNFRGIPMRPELFLTWQHEYLDDSRAIDSRLASGAGNIFTVHSPTFGRDSLTMNATFTIQWTKHVSTFAGFQGNFFAQNFAAMGGDAGFSIGF